MGNGNRDMMTLEGRQTQGCCGTNLLKISRKDATKQMGKPILVPYWSIYKTYLTVS